MKFGNVLNGELKLLETRPEVSEVTNRILMKDIPLDHVSNASIFGLGRRCWHRADDKMLNLWGTAEAKTLRALPKKNKSVGHQFEDVKQQSAHLSCFFRVGSGK